MKVAERKYLYPAAFFGTVAVAVPYLMRVEAFGRHALNPIRLGPLTLPGPIKPMTVSLLSGLVALHYLFKKQKVPDKSEEQRLHGELEEAREQLAEAQKEIQDLQNRQPPQPDRSEEQRLRGGLDEAKNEVKQLRLQYQQLFKSTKGTIDRKNNALIELQKKLNELNTIFSDLTKENGGLERQLKVAREEISYLHKLLSQRLPNNGYCMNLAVIEDLERLEQELRALNSGTVPPDDPHSN